MRDEILADICFTLGQASHAANDLPEAERRYSQTLSLVDAPAIHEAMGYALVMQRKFKEAIPHWTKAMEDTDKFKQDLAQYNRGLCYLMIGDYLNGFKDYDTRMRMGATEDILRKKIGTRPMWDGTPCDHLLVYGEQGMGDLFMFSRLVSELVERNIANKITFEVPKEMVSFMSYNYPEVGVVGMTDKITESDEHVLLISLSRIFGITKDTIPEECLSAEPKYINKWENINKLPGFKVGLCWAGRSEAEQDMQVREWNSRRSIALKQLSPIFGVPGVTFISLQKGIDESQADEFPAIHRPDIKNWSDTAGIMHHLDLVISIDSGPVHLAGALGKTTLLLNHKHTCWRWGLEGEKAPWYDSVRVLRQEQEGDWSAPIMNAYDILMEMTKKKEVA